MAEHVRSSYFPTPFLDFVPRLASRCCLFISYLTGPHHLPIELKKFNDLNDKDMKTSGCSKHDFLFLINPINDLTYCNDWMAYNPSILQPLSPWALKDTLTK